MVETEYVDTDPGYFSSSMCLGTDCILLDLTMSGKCTQADNTVEGDSNRR